MKKYLLSVVILSLVMCAFSQQANAQKENGPVLTFEKKNHDFGDIHQGDVVEQTYKFTNTGTEPLIITNVQVTCGCTTPKWPRDPVPPGGKGEITVGFNSTGKIGRQNKVITVVSNAANPEGGQISFVTNVLEKKQPQ